MNTDTNPDPYARRFTFPKWSRTVTVTDEPRLFGRLAEFHGWTKTRHEATARDYAAQAAAATRVYRSTIDHALAAYGDGTGVLISGVVREHFPEQCKDGLRASARAIVAYTDKSRAHWLASGRRLETWRAMFAATYEN